MTYRTNNSLESIRRLRRAGFTLIELMVLVVLLGMMVGVVTVSWRSVLPRENLAADVRVLAARISGTRSEAISRSAEFFVHIDMENSMYWVETPFNGEGEFEANIDERVNLQHTKLSDGVLFSSISINDEEYSGEVIQIRFDPLGRTDEVRIVLHQPAYERWYAVELVALTGLLRFHKDVYFQRRPADDNDFN